MTDLKKYVKGQIRMLEDWDDDKILNDFGRGRLNAYKDVLEQLPIHDVVHWLPFIPDNYETFRQIANKNKLLKLFDDGSVVKQGDEEPLSICTHFAQQ